MSASCLPSIDLICLASGTSNKTYRVPRLDEHRPWPGEFAHQALPRREARDDAARSDPLHHVLGIPGDQVAIVDNVLFSIIELPGFLSVPHDQLMPTTRAFSFQERLTSFLIIAPKLVSHNRPVPLTL